MTGEIIVMTGPDYVAWDRAQPRGGDTLARQGEALYAKLGYGLRCDAGSPGPGALQTRRPVWACRAASERRPHLVADADYLKRAILRPRDDVVAGYEPIMPSYAQLLNGDDADALVAWLASAWGGADERYQVAPDYLHDGHTLSSWLFTTDHKRIGILYALSITLFFFIGAAAIATVRLLGHALGRTALRRYLQQTVHPPWHRDGVVLPQFPIPSTLGNAAADDRGELDRLPAANLPSWHLCGRRGFHAGRDPGGGVDTGWTFYSLLFDDVLQPQRVAFAAMGVIIVAEFLLRC